MGTVRSVTYVLIAVEARAQNPVRRAATSLMKIVPIAAILPGPTTIRSALSGTVRCAMQGVTILT